MGVSHWMPKNASTASKACMIPAVEAHVLRRDAPADRERRQDQDKQDEHRGEEHHPEELALRIAEPAHVDGVHLHARVGAEVGDDEDDARDPGPLGEEVLRIHRRRRAFPARGRRSRGRRACSPGTSVPIRTPLEASWRSHRCRPAAARRRASTHGSDHRGAVQTPLAARSGAITYTAKRSRHE